MKSLLITICLITICTDGSNDTGLEKMIPKTIKIFDVNQEVHHRFVDMT